MDKEKRYIQKRIWKARFMSIPFYICRIFPIKKNKIVFCCIEGTTGYSCNPKYIAEECLRRNSMGETNFELIWLVNDPDKQFPRKIKVVKNTLWNRAYQLATSKIWIDNSRKQLEVRKRKKQLYIQTWHAKLGFKPTCLDRGKSFSRIAYLVSKHDSDMIDFVLSNSKWYEDTLPTGMLYTGKTLRMGSPRCDILVNRTSEEKARIRKQYNLPEDAKFIMYAPTFRGGNQGTNRTVELSEEEVNYDNLVKTLAKRFGGTWYVLLRLHPQLVVRNILKTISNAQVIDISKEDDMYQYLAGCDAFLTDYSSAAFDAAVMNIPVFLYCNDYSEYQEERGKLLWDMEKLPFSFAQIQSELIKKIEQFDSEKYQCELEQLNSNVDLNEDGNAATKVVDFIEEF